MSDHPQNHAPERPFDTGNTFVEILHTLVNDFDVIEVLTQLTSRCVELLNVNAAGILLADATGHLRIVGASSEQIRLLELFQLQNEQGPCLDCYTTGETVAAPDLNRPTPWPKFATASVNAGYLSVYAIPLHHNRVTLGCLNLFKADAKPLAPSDIGLARALADVASVAIVQSHANQQTNDRDGRLNHALASRITIEQAKGMIAEHFAVDVHEAFEMLRSHAHYNNRSLTGTADHLVDGTINIDAVRRRTQTQETFELAWETVIEERKRIVRIGGELDLATREACLNICVSGGSDTVEVDISSITFMDCSGYGALVAAQLALAQQGRSLTISHATSQPAHLLKLLAEYEDDDPSLLQSGLHGDTSPVRDGAADRPTRFRVTARSIRQSLTRLNPLQSSRLTVTRSSDMDRKPQRGTIIQIQPPTKSHSETTLGHQTNDLPPKL